MFREQLGEEAALSGVSAELAEVDIRAPGELGVVFAGARSGRVVVGPSRALVKGEAIAPALVAHFNGLAMLLHVTTALGAEQLVSPLETLLRTAAHVRSFALRGDRLAPEWTRGRLSMAAQTMDTAAAIGATVERQQSSFYSLAQYVQAIPDGLRPHAPHLRAHLLRWQLCSELPKNSSIGKDSGGIWATSRLKEYPPAMCGALAAGLLDAIGSAPSDPTHVVPDDFSKTCHSLLCSDFGEFFGPDFAGVNIV